MAQRCRRSHRVLWCLVVLVAGCGAQQPEAELLPAEVAAGAELVLAAGRRYEARATLEVRGALVVQPGVSIRFASGTALVVRRGGVLRAQGTWDSRIVLEGPVQDAVPFGEPATLRLVDGPTTAVGRVQAKHGNTWRSVCTNSRNWTAADVSVACRQLGFNDGGAWWRWMEAEPSWLLGPRPRMLLEQPMCSGTETQLQDCAGWAQRRIGAGTCDFHPDLAISCSPVLDPAVVTQHWEGLHFEYALASRVLTQENTLYVMRSSSQLSYVDIRYAGAGPSGAALFVNGVPPHMTSVAVLYSARDGINATSLEAPLQLNNCTLHGNKGYGLFANVTSGSGGQVLLESCTISENGGDGVHYVSHDPRPGLQTEGMAQLQAQPDPLAIALDFCTLSTTTSQIYPLLVRLEQPKNSVSQRDCSKAFYTKMGYVLTAEVVAVSSGSGAAHIFLRDGSGSGDNLLADTLLYQGSLPQSTVTTGNRLYVQFRAPTRDPVPTVAFLRVTAGRERRADLLITSSTVADNGGSGIAVDEARSAVILGSTSVSGNSGTAGLRIIGGAAAVNVSNSRIAFNRGDGVNVSHCGGIVNISRSSISSNSRTGLSVWHEMDPALSYTGLQRTVILEYSEIFRNQEVGALIGNFCRESFVNITGNWFNESNTVALEILSCWQQTNGMLWLQVGHNTFTHNRLGFRINPPANIDGRIEYNNFRQHEFGAMSLRMSTAVQERLAALPVRLLVANNYFEENRGMYVANLGLCQDSINQHLLFTWNFLRNNHITEPWGLDQPPRGSAAAALTVASDNIDIFRNIFQNPESAFEIASHLSDQSRSINCTYNWLGNASEDVIFYRLFHRKDRYNLSRLRYLPYLLHPSNPAATAYVRHHTYIAPFIRSAGIIGGEVDGREVLGAGEYEVRADITVRPGGLLELRRGAVLRFPPALGVMVAGQLEARGTRPGDIRLGLLEVADPVTGPETDTDAGNTLGTITAEVDERPVRLLGGTTETEGRLQIRVNGTWGTVCSYGWTQRNSVIVCRQLGLAPDPDGWLMAPAELPQAGTGENILMSNVRCGEEDVDITQCRAEHTVAGDMYGACTHQQDVGLRCLRPAWAGVRLAPTARRSDLQFVTIEHAGLLDFNGPMLKPGLQVDLWRHAMESIRVENSLQDGLGVIYSDLYSTGAARTVKNSEFRSNHGNGISIRQFGLKVSGCTLEKNDAAGLRHEPIVSLQDRRDLAGWLMPPQPPHPDYAPIVLPAAARTHLLENDETKIFVTTKVPVGDSVDANFTIKVLEGYVLGLQLLNMPLERSTERLSLVDGPSRVLAADILDLREDRTHFPMLSSSSAVVLEYRSGEAALGGMVLAVSAVRAPAATAVNRRGPPPTLTIVASRIRHNANGLHLSYYSRLVGDAGELYLRTGNETMEVMSSEVTFNKREAVLVDSPRFLRNSTAEQTDTAPLAEVNITIDSTLLTDNGAGIHQHGKDLRGSANLFHWQVKDSSVERNKAGGFVIELPYVWQYNENFTHSVVLMNNTWRNNFNFAVEIGGHFARLNVSKNMFRENVCHASEGLLSVRGMEKLMLLNRNLIEGNRCHYLVEFGANSQSEILGTVPAFFIFNEVRRNTAPLQQNTDSNPSFAIGFRGVQKVQVRRNLLGDNTVDFELVAGVQTAHLESEVDVAENWWGTTNATEIRERIFDFDDWNNHALAHFLPFLTEDSLDSSVSVSWETPVPVDPDNLHGRLDKSMTLNYRELPYIVRSDLTILPQVTLSLSPGVVIEFAPNVGILVLGSLKANGRPGQEVILRPLTHQASSDVTTQMASVLAQGQPTVRLCTLPNNCTGEANKQGSMQARTAEGFLERYNRTSLQWVPICDPHFCERDAQVVCRELGFDSNVVFVSHGRQYSYHAGSVAHIAAWPEPLQCRGDELHYEDCRIHLDGRAPGAAEHRCSWDGDFVFLHCGQRNLQAGLTYWGGIRFANPDLEWTHSPREESYLEGVNLTGAGLLHRELSPAILAIGRTPAMAHVTVERSASDGISLIAPASSARLQHATVNNVLGVGVTVLSLTGEARDEGASSFAPLADASSLPRHLFGAIDVCGPDKHITVEERVLVYFKYDNRPVSCVKVFSSVYYSKPFGFRFLELNLQNGSVVRPDSLTLFEGYVNGTAPLATLLATTEPSRWRHLYRTRGAVLGLHMVSAGGGGDYGFIAEIITLPVSAVGFDRDAQHNITGSVLAGCRLGAIRYQSAGEVNPLLAIDKCRILNNCLQLYGNFSTCQSAVEIDVQNMEGLYFKNNAVLGNVGGLSVSADSRGSATALRGFVGHNAFAHNKQQPTLRAEGRQSSPYQQLTIYRNYFSRNEVPYRDFILLRQVVTNFSYNFVQNNIGCHILEVSGFEKVRLPIYQITYNNSFYWNAATKRESRSTVVAATAGQHYVDNVFWNPDNDYELITVNRSLTSDVQDFPGDIRPNNWWEAPIDARYNWWGTNVSAAVSARIKDIQDDPQLIQVDYQPFYTSNTSLLGGGKCPPGWGLHATTCLAYIGAPLTFQEARSFCKLLNASMPYISGDYFSLYQFIRSQQPTFQYYDRAWVQHLDSIGKCTVFAFQRVTVDDCDYSSPFLCEIDPKVNVDPLSWRRDALAVSVLGAVCVALLLVMLAAACWWAKSRHRRVERLERRNSIRQSLRSLRSVGMSSTTELDPRPAIVPAAEYHKMQEDSGSLDSVEKSRLESSVDDSRSYSYDIYEASNPSLAFLNHSNNGPGGLMYRNEGFHDRSLPPFRAADHDSDSSGFPPSTPEPLPRQDPQLVTLSQPKLTPVSELHSLPYSETATLPLSRSPTLPLSEVHSTQPADTEQLPLPHTQSLPLEPVKVLPISEPRPLPLHTQTLPLPHTYTVQPTPLLLETDLDAVLPPPPPRSRSEAALLEEVPQYTESLARAHSQPLETAM
ncbi:protein bark beetle [Schistocerca cancellata]|uniref:protein bark beetle n=1 Tax=Schistocerca cancellata TaxID=274614 RepID=UPI0021178A5F|nr:protein bark beetle [Schistocerca cancellata]